MRSVLCCSVSSVLMQRVAACCSVLQRVGEGDHSISQPRFRVAVCCSVRSLLVQCVAVCGSELGKVMT